MAKEHAKKIIKDTKNKKKEEALSDGDGDFYNFEKKIEELSINNVEVEDVDLDIFEEEKLAAKKKA